MIDFSIILMSFNASVEQVEHTVLSVINQKDVNLEVIVCDDCSRDNHFDFVEALMKEHNFTNYQLIGAEKNMGTIRNILRGIQIARGKYAKLLGYGDLLYRDTTLREVYQFMEEGNHQSCFGLIQGYKQKDGEVFPAEHKSPLEIGAYREKNRQNIAKNILIAEDWVSGVSIFATTEYYNKYISLLKDKVIYCEDWATALALVDGEYLALLDDYVVWYEVGEGVSTTPNPVWRAKLLEDNRQFWNVFKEYAEKRGVDSFDGCIRANARKKTFDKISISGIQFLLKAITNPHLILFWSKVMLKKEKQNVGEVSNQNVFWGEAK